MSAWLNLSFVLFYQLTRFVSISGDIVDTHIVELCKGDHTVKGNNDLSALIFAIVLL